MDLPPPHPDANFRRSAAILAGLVVVLVALALRWPQIRDSLWLDELHTAWCVSGSWSDVAPRATFGNQSPFYFYLLRGIVGVCGMSELTLRLPSFMAGIALLGVTAAATTRWTGSTIAGLLAAGLVALDRNCIFYSQEARPYAILQLVAWCHVLVVWELARQATFTRRVLFVCGAILQFYLHYTSVLFLAAEVVFLLGTMFRQDRRDNYHWKQLGLDLAIIAAATLPVASHVAEIGSRRALWERFVQTPNLHDFWFTLRLDVYLLPCVATLVACGLLSRASIAETDAASPLFRRSMSLVGCLLLVPAMVAWVATRQHLAALFLGRYLVSSLVAAPISAALVCRRVPSTWMRNVAAIITVAGSLWTSGMWQQWQHDRRILGDRKQDWRGAVEFVNHHASSSNSICYVRSGFVEASGLRSAHEPLLDEYCLAPVNSLYRLQVQAIPLSSAPTIDIDPAWIRSDAPHVRWLLINGSNATRQQLTAEVERQCRDLGLPEAFERVETFGDVLVLKLARMK